MSFSRLVALVVGSALLAVVVASAFLAAWGGLERARIVMWMTWLGLALFGGAIGPRGDAQ